MVHKTSHRGVHSGNTLRAFNSRYSRRYHSQACIVSRVRPELLKTLVSGSDAGDDAAADTRDAALRVNNVAVDVALSLNKHARWLLPAALIRQIRSDDVAHSHLTVSLLERHKLKRPASCVSFHSNKGEVKRIQPRNGRYFSFNFPMADGKSRRAYRREQREELVQQLKASDSGTKIAGKKIEVFTALGRAARNMDIGESEVRYEVFYPSPAHSSLAHNPKYIKHHISVAPGDQAEHVQHGRSRKQHRGKQRKRMCLKDLDDCDLPSFHSHHHDDHHHHLPDVADTEDVTQTAGSTLQHQTTDCLLSSLIEKAERLQNLVVGVAKTRHRKKSGSKTGGHHEDDKKHIVYLHQAGEVEDSEADSAASPGVLQTALPVPAPAPSHCTRVLVPSDDVTVASLKDCFGQRYFEAACRPRKFVLDVTSNVREMLKKRGVQPYVADRTADALTYLVFIHDGFYDDEHHVYKVLLNSRLREGLLPVPVDAGDAQDLYRATVLGLVSRAVDFAQTFVAELQEQNRFPAVLEGAELKGSHRELKHHLGSAQVYIPSLERIFQMGSGLNDVTLPSLSDMLQEEPAFCDVCYDDVSPLTQDSAPATALLKCQHRVCDSCWSQHIHSRLQQGFVRVTCPGHDCQEEVGVGVLLTVAALDTAEKVLQRQEEVRIGASPTEKWCPNQACGRVLRLQPASTSATPQLQQDVVCACGAHVCFQCLAPAHWPASCAQAEDYRGKLATTVFPDRQAEVHDDSGAWLEARLKREREASKLMLVEGKHCPRCHNFVYKNGGCPQMTCRCGQLFCWYCGKAGFSHPNRGPGCVDVDMEKKLTTTIVVRHLEFSTEEKKEEKQKAASAQRQRVSLMERAAEHRQRRESGQHSKVIASMARAVSAAAAKDATLAQHIVSVCCNTFPCEPSAQTSHAQTPATQTPPTQTPAQTPPTHTPRTHTPPARGQKGACSVLEVVAGFLKRCARSKHELHEVAEYSLVLLKDLPDSLLRRRALRISEDLGAFCTFTHSIFEAWLASPSHQGHGQEGVKAVVRLAEIQGWINSALASHVATVRKLRRAASDKQ